MDGEEPTSAARAKARAAWPVRRYRLGEEPSDNLAASTTAAERLAMVGELTQEAWSLGGAPLPTYTRAETPIRVIPSPVRRTSDPEKI